MIRRGEVRQLALSEGRSRLAAVLGRDAVNQNRPTVLVVPIAASGPDAPPIVVPVASAGEHAVALVDQVRAVPKDRLGEKTGVLSREELRRIEEALRQVLEL